MKLLWKIYWLEYLLCPCQYWFGQSTLGRKIFLTGCRLCTDYFTSLTFVSLFELTINIFYNVMKGMLKCMNQALIELLKYNFFMILFLLGNFFVG